MPWQSVAVLELFRNYQTQSSTYYNMNTALITPNPAYAKVSHQAVSVKGLDIFYREAGSPERPTILMLHGFPSSSHMYRELIPPLANDFHVIAPDYPGF